MEARCGHCLKVKSDKDFPSNKSKSNGLASWCYDCTKIKATAWRKKNKKQIRYNNLKNRFNLTRKEVDTTLEYQNNECMICRISFEETEFCVDHDHSCCSGKGHSCGDCVRGFLCHRCNLLVGYLENNLNLIDRAVLYIKREHHDIKESF